MGKIYGGLVLTLLVSLLVMPGEWARCSSIGDGSGRG
ncbi:MAG: hypothetical protein ACI9NQ_000750 [Paracoccaceae bacterium]|jgi:hypothetical protein